MRTWSWVAAAFLIGAGLGQLGRLGIWLFIAAMLVIALMIYEQVR